MTFGDHRAGDDRHKAEQILLDDVRMHGTIIEWGAGEAAQSRRRFSLPTVNIELSPADA